MQRSPLHRGSPRVLAVPQSALTAVWVVVNLVNLLQAAGFALRVVDPDLNRSWVSVSSPLGSRPVWRS